MNDFKGKGNFTSGYVRKGNHAGRPRTYEIGVPTRQVLARLSESECEALLKFGDGSLANGIRFLIQTHLHLVEGVPLPVPPPSPAAKFKAEFAAKMARTQASTTDWDDTGDDE